VSGTDEALGGADALSSRALGAAALRRRGAPAGAEHDRTAQAALYLSI